MEKDPQASESQNDIVATQSAALSVEVEKVAIADSNYVAAEERDLRRIRAEADIRFSVRKDFLESPRNDPNGFERIIKQPDVDQFPGSRPAGGSGRVPDQGAERWRRLVWNGVSGRATPFVDQSSCAWQCRRGQSVRRPFNLPRVLMCPDFFVGSGMRVFQPTLSATGAPRDRSQISGLFWNLAEVD
ncbi:hypothetical protein [Rhizobium leguminosarum]|uniref:hypothetical protein n=1 Tax=Rhizobium leguminosarum TaxID=384 RepID=UPI001FEFD2D8|nr:hypothetical protein [Rhizobium leguminosarum]